MNKHLINAYIEAITEMVGMERYEEMTGRKVRVYDRIYNTARYEALLEVIIKSGYEPEAVLNEEDILWIDSNVDKVVKEYFKGSGRRFSKEAEIYKTGE